MLLSFQDKYSDLNSYHPLTVSGERESGQRGRRLLLLRHFPGQKWGPGLPSEEEAAARSSPCALAGLHSVFGEPTHLVTTVVKPRGL